MSLDVTDGMHRFSEAVGVPSSPHIIFWPFSLHGSTSYFLYSWRRLPCLASQSCLLSLHSWLFISIFDIFLEVVPFEMVIVMVHETQRNRDLFSSELLKCRYFLTQLLFYWLPPIVSLSPSSFVFPGVNQILLLCPPNSRGPSYPSIFLESPSLLGSRWEGSTPHTGVGWNSAPALGQHSL